MGSLDLKGIGFDAQIVKLWDMSSRVFKTGFCYYSTKGFVEQPKLFTYCCGIH